MNDTMRFTGFVRWGAMNDAMHLIGFTCRGAIERHFGRRIGRRVFLMVSRPPGFGHAGSGLCAVQIHHPDAVNLRQPRYRMPDGCGHAPAVLAHGRQVITGTQAEIQSPGGHAGGLGCIFG